MRTVWSVVASKFARTARWGSCSIEEKPGQALSRSLHRRYYAALCCKDQIFSCSDQWEGGDDRSDAARRSAAAG